MLNNVNVKLSKIRVHPFQDEWNRPNIKHKPYFSDLASVVDNPELYKCMALIKRVRNVVSLLNWAFTINQLSVYRSI